MADNPGDDEATIRAAASACPHFAIEVQAIEAQAVEDRASNTHEEIDP